LAYIDFQATRPFVRRGVGGFCLGNYESLRKGDVKAKKKKQKRLTSAEFLRLYETLWQEGPKVKYVNPDNWRGIAD
jgi:hypothetical protein